MATKQEKVRATQVNLQMAQSKLESLKKRDEELAAKIQRLNLEREQLRKKATNLTAQIQKLSLYLQRQR